MNRPKEDYFLSHNSKFQNLCFLHLQTNMSRHQLVKSLNVDDILDDYNGGSDYEYDGEQAGATELSQDDDGLLLHRSK